VLLPWVWCLPFLQHGVFASIAGCMLAPALCERRLPLSMGDSNFRPPPRNPHPDTHTHPFNDPVSGTSQVSRYKTNQDFTEARDSEWQWHQLGHMQVCTSLQTDNHASTPPLSFLQARCPSAAQPTASNHWRQNHTPWPITKKFATGDQVSGPYSSAKFGTNMPMGASGQMREI